MSVPLSSSTPLEGETELASEEGEDTTMESEKERELELCLRERRVMETKQEMNRIELMGKVSLEFVVFHHILNL